MKKPLRPLIALAALACAALPGAGGAVTVAPLPSGTAHVVNAGPGNQTDPHISGSLVSYTSEYLSTSTEIRYHDLATGADAAIPGSTGWDFLSDVSGSTIVFTRVTAEESAIRFFDTATGIGAEVAPEVASNRHAPALGGRTVAFQDFSFNASPLEPEVVAASLDGGLAARLTMNNRLERDIAVSPDGDAIVWTDCNTSGTDCDIWSARRAGGVWTTANVTASAFEEGTADTNGSLVVYCTCDPYAATEWDVYWRPVTGGAETRLPLAGFQSNPNISGNFVAFESSSTAGGARDVHVYDLATDRLYQVTSTPDDESLSDISVSATGLARVAYQVREVGNFNIRAYSFQLPAAKTPAELLADLIALVESFNLRQGIENSLDAKLENARKALERMNAGDKATACNLLGAFVNEVTAQSGKALTPDQASQLVTAANAVKTALGCS